MRLGKFSFTIAGNNNRRPTDRSVALLAELLSRFCGAAAAAAESILEYDGGD